MKKVDLRIVFGAIMFGSVWGMLEATLGGILHLLYFPFTGIVMRSIGFSIMAMAVSVYKKPSLSIPIGIIAGLTKLLDFFILPLSVVKVVRPAIAIVTEGLAFGIVMLFVWNLYDKKISLQGLSGIFSGYLCLVFYSLSIVFIFGYYPNGRETLLETLKFIVTSGTSSAFLSMFLVPLGWWVGKQVKIKEDSVIIKEPRLYYWKTGFLSVFCWVVILITAMFEKGR